MNCEQLQAMVENVDWEQFREPNDGNLHVWDGQQLIRFAYRIGLHLKRPMQAVMAKGHFIKMVAVPEFEPYYLARLDPENVDATLYKGPNINLYLPYLNKEWMPKTLKITVMQQAQRHIPQGQMSQYQTFQHVLVRQQFQEANRLRVGVTTTTITT